MIQQTKKTSWQSVRDAIAQDIEDGVLVTGARLPTEPELAKLHGVGRHSIRRAVLELAKEGRVSVEQGRGTFVLPRPIIDYAIGRRTRLSRNFRALGIEVAGETLGSETLKANRWLADQLGVRKSSKVIATRRITFADGVPVAFGTLYHDARRFPDFPERRAALGSVSAVYASYGIEDYLRASTSMQARPGTTEEAKMLRQHRDLPVIVVHAVDRLQDGAPLSCSEVVWAAARVKFTYSEEDET